MRLGTDIIEIARIKKAVQRNSRFPEKILSPSELEVYEAYKGARALAFLAGRFAAKEAYSKALGSGMYRDGLRFKKLSIMNDALGAPKLIEGPEVEGVCLSISHSEHYALAVVIIED